MNSESAAEPDIIDADLGITFDDFRSSLMLLRVTDNLTSLVDSVISEFAR